MSGLLKLLDLLASLLGRWLQQERKKEQKHSHTAKILKFARHFIYPR